MSSSGAKREKSFIKSVQAFVFVDPTAATAAPPMRCPPLYPSLYTGRAGWDSDVNAIASATACLAPPHRPPSASASHRF
ncbi:hypothetical protein B0H16DRAFT_1709523 [Mycena metata]|uniref:Uncharacterized protein n=1 Tax=Mycena metata TaxID=1033252 RepID=A0AAD7KBY7_9AGAR|nr:hypothetical protein B0H16DRAFT_1709523 [Mycena metata]